LAPQSSLSFLLFLPNNAHENAWPKVGCVCCFVGAIPRPRRAVAKIQLDQSGCLATRNELENEKSQGQELTEGNKSVPRIDAAALAPK
jgi:hypothetical protein